MTKIQLRRDTAANWSTNNPTPSAGEPCFETDTGKLKIGDGITAYNSLPYQGGSGSGLELCDIGIALYVDETKGLRRYLNGQIVDINTNTQAFLDRLQEITTLHPSLLCTEEEWQSTKTMSAFGQVGKFVFNYSNGEIVSVRLPRVVNVQGLFDLQNLGMTVGAGLPNITGNFRSYEYGWAPLGAFSISSTASEAPTAGTSTSMDWINFNASHSNPIYGKSNTVQPEAIQYPYFIQIATGGETENNIINEIELNNPYSLFDSKYSDHELNNLSWLKSEGQWNAKAVYPDAYDKLLKVYNGTETVEGLSVKLSTETYTDYDFVLNTADETFRLPLKTKLASGKAVVGNGYTMGLFDGVNTSMFGIAAGSNTWQTRAQQSNFTVGQAFPSGSGPLRSGHPVGLSTDATKSGIETSDNDLYLYFYVGEAVQNANLIDAGRIGEQLATKTDMQQAAKASMPSNKYIDLTLGAAGTTYTAPADGYFILTGSLPSSSDVGHVTLINRLNTTSGTDGKFTVRCYGVGSPSVGLGLYASVPAKAGDNVVAAWGGKATATILRFIYAVGSEPSS